MLVDADPLHLYHQGLSPQIGCARHIGNSKQARGHATREEQQSKPQRSVRARFHERKSCGWKWQEIVISSHSACTDLSQQCGIPDPKQTMRITQLRNATLVLEFSSQGRPVGLLVDPMLAPRGALPALRYLGVGRQRNPTVDLPPGTDAVLDRVTHALITHCQRGHFDHLDRAGKHFLRERRIPVYCMPRDAGYLAQRGLVIHALADTGRQEWELGGHITPVPCVHGRGLVGRFMEHGHGYVLDLPGEPTVYLAGDTVMTAEVRHCLSVLQPDVAVLPAGGARFDLGAEILMGASDIAEAARLTKGSLVANHLQALDHCPTTRASVRALARQEAWAHRLWVPEDGEVREYLRPATPVSPLV